MCSTGCLGAETVLAYIEGRTDDRAKNDLDRHLDTCADCRAVVLEAGDRSAHSHGGFAARMSAAPIFPPGSILAQRYRVGRLLGRGGMGEVYVAEDMHLGTQVALKTVNALVADRAGLTARLKREVLLARQVTHPSVCRVFDLGTHDEVVFMTMEHLEGETLGARLRRLGPLADRDALPIVEQLVGALDAAHGAGIIHRDFKSDNVILTREDAGGVRAVVTDFGLARPDPARLRDPAGSIDSGPPRLLGTLSYMAPEQIEGGAITSAVDIYALGVVIFEMVTGQLPFTDPSPMRGAMRRLVERPTSPRHLVPALPPHWDAAILRCLQREPGQRFQNVRAVSEALGSQPIVSTTRRTRRADRLVGALVISGLAVTTGLLLSPSSPPPSPVSAAAGRRDGLPPVDARLTRAEQPPAPGPAERLELPAARPRPKGRHRPSSNRADQVTGPAPAAPPDDRSAVAPVEDRDELLDPRDNDLLDPYRVENRP